MRRFEDRHNRLEFGENSCKFCFGGKSAPDAPDMSGLAATSEYAAELGFATAMEQLDWSRQQWDQQQELIYSVLDVQMPIMMEQWEQSKEQWNWAKEDRERYKTLFEPLQEDLIKEFQDYASPERMELEAGRAGADVTRAFQAQRENAQRQLESYGIDPSQTRSQALDANMRAQEAAAQAGAENQSRKQVEAEGRALRAEALNIGKGMPSQYAQMAGLAGQSGQGAAGIGQGAIGGYSGAFGTAAGTMGSPTQWMNTGMSGIGQSANIQNMGYQNQLAGWNAQQATSPWNVGLSAAGMGLGYFAAEGGAIDGPGGPKDDAISAKLSDGEFVIPAEVVERKGTEFFDKLVGKTREDPAVQKRMADMQAQKQAAIAPPTSTNRGLPIPQEIRMSNGGIAIAPKVRNPTMRPPPAGYDPTFVAPKVRNPTMRPPPAGYDPTFVAPKVRNPTMRYGRQQPRQPTNPTARQPAGWNGGDWRQGYTPPGGSRWSDRLRQGNGNTSSGRSSQIRDWISQRVRSRGQEQTWRDEMLANTGPADRQQAQQWIRDHPGETMEGTYNPNTWQYAAQQYQNRPGPGSLWDLPAFQRYRDKYGITPPGPGHMRV